MSYDVGVMQSMTTSAANSAGVPSNIFHALIFSESSYNPSAYNSEYGASGIAQFIPSTAKSLGVDSKNPESSLTGAAKYLRDIYDNQTNKNWLEAVGIYKGKSGNTDVKVSYAENKLTGRDLTLKNGEVIVKDGQFTDKKKVELWNR